MPKQRRPCPAVPGAGLLPGAELSPRLCRCSRIPLCPVLCRARGAGLTAVQGTRLPGGNELLSVTVLSLTSARESPLIFLFLCMCGGLGACDALQHLDRLSSLTCLVVLVPGVFPCVSKLPRVHMGVKNDELPWRV